MICLLFCLYGIAWWTRPVCTQHKIRLAWLGRHAPTRRRERGAGEKGIRGILFSTRRTHTWCVSHWPWLHPNAPRAHLRSSFLIDMVFHILLRTFLHPSVAQRSTPRCGTEDGQDGPMLEKCEYGGAKETQRLFGATTWIVAPVTCY